MILITKFNTLYEYYASLRLIAHCPPVVTMDIVQLDGVLHNWVNFTKQLRSFMAACIYSSREVCAVWFQWAIVIG